MSVFDDFDDIFRGSPEPTDDIEFSTDTYHRRVVILLIDVSGSMRFAEQGTRPIDELNRSMRAWLPEIRKQGEGPLRAVEFAVVTFGGDGVRAVTGDPRRAEAELAQDGGAFVPAADLDFGDLTASGTTPMVEALEFALRLGDRRVQHLADQHGLQTGQVRLILFSDGEPNDELPADAWRSVADLIGARRRQRRLLFLAFGAPGADEEMLRTLATDRGYIPLTDLDFAGLLDLVLVATSAEDPYTAVWEQAHWDPDEAAPEDGPAGPQPDDRP
ncbi:VWA domain-containing protein [Streptomyces sp. NPDC007905]|uniref:vWA domain-containing protein n=1 Tax=Streptomyces sp. NPDC007905 TaxID=3364788 RepID=UPI0036E9ED55